MPTAFDVMFNASISRSENYSSDSLTKLPTICLYGLGFFANIVLLYFLLKSFNLLNINNMHNFLYINLFINLIPPCKGQNENSKRDKRDETIVK